MTVTQLVSRIQDEYREMPGHRLTLAQATRLWHVDAETCEQALHALVAKGWLLRTPAGHYLAVPSSGPLRATLYGARERRQPA